MENSLHDIFIQEAEENLQLLENLIINLEEDPENTAMINDAFRSIHSIKGGAGLAGFSKIKDFTHIVEDLFENIRNGTLKIEEELISVILASMDIMKIMISNIKDGVDSNQDLDTSLSVEAIQSILNKEPKSPEVISEKLDKKVSNSDYYISLNYDTDLFLTGIDPLMFIGDLKGIGSIYDLELMFDDKYDVSYFNPEKQHLYWQLFFSSEKNEQDILDIFCFVIDEADIKIKALTGTSDDQSYLVNNRTMADHLNLITSETKSDIEESEYLEQPATNLNPKRRKTDRRADAAASYIRVPTEKLEMIFNTVSELLISQARLTMLTEEFEDIIPESFNAVADSLKNQNQLLQEQVTSLRMMNLSGTFDRFKRVVRDMASDMGKKIRLEIAGQDTELDKNMIEKLNDPLKHLVRNCIDHGIETQEKRLEQGKEPEGTLKLSAYLENGKVVIEVSDDGCGIDKKKLLKKAISCGITQADNRLTDNEILNLIFHPGLSTAEKITDISGRGVGMDVVKSSINELHGNVDVISNEGQGTCFKLNLPLTLAILDGMLVAIGVEKYIIPTLAILEIFRPDKKDLKTISGGKELVLFRGNYVPVIRLHKIFDIDSPIDDPIAAQFIVVNSGGVKVALLVDSVLEQYQIVLKSLQRNFKKVANISSATILGDGDVALIVDIPSIVKDHQKHVNE